MLAKLHDRILLIAPESYFHQFILFLLNISNFLLAWQILFLSSLFLSISTTLYCFCPEFIKENPSFEVFSRSGLDGQYCFQKIFYDKHELEYYNMILSNFNQDHILNFLNANDPRLEKHFISNIFVSNGFNTASENVRAQFLFLWCNKNPAEAYRFVTQYLNKSKLPVRIVSTLSYYIALGCVLYITLENVWFGLNYIFSNLQG